ncbi:Zn-dependent hydrolase [Pseudonocardia phyllosphaerae]|uniref:Zn-dependent hydrolase n=1 Tax=Pseudonocardia phyllosphaerae TaxID=3390502 RepID=UPI003977F6CB
MQPADLDVRIDAARFDAWIAEFAALTEPGSGPGVTRLAYTPLERSAHAAFAAFMSDLGLIVWTDAAGNTIAEHPGTEPGLAAVGTGSHLDSVPAAGAFDGIAGVVASMVVAEAIVRTGTTHRRPIRFVAFASEEGARFGQACLGSRIAAGLTGPDDLHRLRDADGISVAAAMTGLGLDAAAAGDARWDADDWAAFVELHIEQGSVLHAEDVPVGVVDVISGSTRLELTLTGTAAHSGGMPMHLRRDALCAAAEIVLDLEALACDDEHDGTRITVGRLDVSPGSITTIPGRATLTVDIRDVETLRQRRTADAVLSRAARIAERRGVGLQSRAMAETLPEELSPQIRSALIDVCRDAGVEPRVLPSGASHDTQMIGTVCPVGMLFVPSRNGGVSHAPEEHSDSDDLRRGAELLAAALLRLDAQL